MEITEIGEYKGETWRLELDSGAVCFVGASVVNDFGLYKGKSLSPDVLESIRGADTLRKAKRRALYLLGTREYCFAELLEKLKKSYPEEIAREAADYIREYGYINDEEYAVKLARHLIHTKRWGLRRARYEMLHRGLDEELVNSALSDYTDDDIDEEITCLIERRYYSKIKDYDDRRRTIAALARRGYDYISVKRCIERLLEDYEEEDVD